MFAPHSKDDRLERTEAACAASLAQWRLPVMAPAPAPGRAARPARASVTICHMSPPTKHSLSGRNENFVSLDCHWLLSISFQGE